MTRTAAARRIDGAWVVPWRARYLAELDAQCRYDATHRRGWADVYAVSLDGVDVGYGAIKGCDEIAARVEVEAILFADDHATDFAVPGAIARPRSDDDEPFEHTAEPVGDMVVEHDGDIVATGGALTHYNPPYADLYMEVRPDARRRGFGVLVLQAVKGACYATGLVPAARTSVTNLASRATLRRAGLRECGLVLAGRVAGP